MSGEWFCGSGLKAWALATPTLSSLPPPRSLLSECSVGRGLSEESGEGKWHGDPSPDCHLCLCHASPYLLELSLFSVCYSNLRGIVSTSEQNEWPHSYRLRRSSLWPQWLCSHWPPLLSPFASCGATTASALLRCGRFSYSCFRLGLAPHCCHPGSACVLSSPCNPPASPLPPSLFTPLHPSPVLFPLLTSIPTRVPYSRCFPLMNSHFNIPC